MLLGFYSYGSGRDEGNEQPWIKILCDTLCYDIAQRTNARLISEGERSKIDDDDEYIDKELSLFAKGYYESLEPFDWWVVGQSGNISGTEAKRSAQLAESIIQHIEKDDYEEETLRALLWLGDRALPILRKTHNKLKSEHIEFLKKHSQSDLEAVLKE